MLTAIDEHIREGLAIDVQKGGRQRRRASHVDKLIHQERCAAIYPVRRLCQACSQNCASLDIIYQGGNNLHQPRSPRVIYYHESFISKLGGKLFSRTPLPSEGARNTGRILKTASYHRQIAPPAEMPPIGLKNALASPILPKLHCIAKHDKCPDAS